MKWQPWLPFLLFGDSNDVRTERGLPLSSLMVALLPLAWLPSSHYFPWLSAWQEGLALSLIVLAGLLARRKGTLPWAWGAAAAVVLLSVAGQRASGLLMFSGDAWMVALYVLAFVLALALGAGLAATDRNEQLAALDLLGAGLLLGALLSALIALVQWAGGPQLPFSVAELPRGTRPFGNLAQPNHLCSVAFLGICGTGLLCESRRIGKVGFWAAAAFLLGAMALTGSRTGWLQLGLFALVAAWRGGRCSARLRVRDAFILLALFALWQLLWPWLNEAALNGGGRSLQDQMRGGTRLPYWRAMLDAVAQAPWAGYGWLQAANAQVTVALEHPPIGYLFEHAHNVVLDLWLWAGLPVGSAIALLGTLALLAQGRALTDARALWAWAAALGLVSHGLVEYPLEYAYFLLPAGVLLGAAQGLNPTQSALRAPPGAQRAVAILLAPLLALVAVDYIAAEQNHRVLRMEAAHIGTLKIESPAPELRVLDQLQALLAFARTEATPNMSQPELEAFGRVAKRWPIPPVMLRHALALGLNGKPDEAQRALGQLCRIHSITRCRELAPAWASLQARYPVLAAIQPPPEARPR